MDLHLPDGRLIERLAASLCAPTVSTSAWNTAGRCLTLGLLAPEPPAWRDGLADAMVGALRQVEALAAEADIADCAALGLTAATLSAARPDVAQACDAAIGRWIGGSVGAIRVTRDPDTAATWALLALLRQDEDRTAEAVDHLVDLAPDGIGLLLHDWAVVALHRHGFQRQVQAFHHLRLGTRGVPRPSWMLLAAIVLVDAAGLPRDGAAVWLREVTRDVLGATAAGATPLPAAGRR